MESIPALSVDLIEALATEIPNRCPDLRDSDRMIWFNAGKRAVVDSLLVLLEDQKEQELKGT